MSGRALHKGPAMDRRLTTCKECGSGIFSHQEYQWRIGASPGLVHRHRKDCG